MKHPSLFLVACTRLYNPLCPSVGWSHFTFFYDFISLTSLLLPKWSSDLKYGPCPPARDFGSRVSGLVYLGLPSTTVIIFIYCDHLQLWKLFSDFFFFFWKFLVQNFCSHYHSFLSSSSSIIFITETILIFFSFFYWNCLVVYLFKLRLSKR